MRVCPVVEGWGRVFGTHLVPFAVVVTAFIHIWLGDAPPLEINTTKISDLVDTYNMRHSNAFHHHHEMMYTSLVTRCIRITSVKGIIQSTNILNMTEHPCFIFSNLCFNVEEIIEIIQRGGTAEGMREQIVGGREEN